jgi:hypothetical protein
VFCTYAHYTPQGRLFYIGKGNEDRARSLKGRNKYWRRVVKKYGKPDVQILANWDTNKEACSHEMLLISCFRELGHELCNMTSGGEGTYGITPWNKGKPWSEEIKVKQGAKNIGNKYWLGKKHTQETIEKQKQIKTKFKFIGTNINTKQTIVIIGKQAMKDAGFCSKNIYGCANGKEKSHKGYTWVKESIRAK